MKDDGFYKNSICIVVRGRLRGGSVYCLEWIIGYQKNIELKLSTSN